MNREIKEPTRLLDENGNVKVPGFARSMLYEYNRKDIKVSKFKIKEWDYYLVYNTKFALALTVADNGYMGLVSASVIDFSKPEETTQSIMTFMPMGKFMLPGTSVRGDVHFKNKKVDFSFQNGNGTRVLRASFKNFMEYKNLEAEIILTNEPTESMVIAIPFDKPKHFYFNQKIVGFRAKGTVKLGSEVINFESKDSFGILDFGRGVWTYKNTWYWSAACGEVDGKVFGFNLGYGFGNTDNATENMLFFDGKSYKIDKVNFEINIPGKNYNYMDDWKFTSNDNSVELTFTPIINRKAYTSALVISSDQNQVFGKFNGTVRLDSKTKLEIKDLLGFAERVANKW